MDRFLIFGSVPVHKRMEQVSKEKDACAHAAMVKHVEAGARMSQQQQDQTRHRALQALRDELGQKSLAGQGNLQTEIKELKTRVKEVRAQCTGYDRKIKALLCPQSKLPEGAFQIPYICYGMEIDEETN